MKLAKAVELVQNGIDEKLSHFDLPPEQAPSANQQPARTADARDPTASQSCRRFRSRAADLELMFKPSRSDCGGGFQRIGFPVVRNAPHGDGGVTWNQASRIATVQMCRRVLRGNNPASAKVAFDALEREGD
jgi:hypothetical protein